MISLKVEKEHEGMNLFDILIQTYTGFNKKTLIQTFKYGNITLNGKEAFGDDKPAHGDIIRIFITGEEAGIDLTPEIIYQDENIVIADKPAGLLTISDKGEANAVDMVEESMKRRGEYSLEALMVPYLIYPLEKEVSGLLIMAKHEDAFLFLSQALAQRRVTRYYVCAVLGEAKESAEMLAFLIQDKQSRNVRVINSQSKDSKPIVTRYTKIKEGEGLSLISARPITNSLHQVRAHLAFEGLLVIGDDMYGDRRFNRKCRVDSVALWLKTVVFEVGTNHEYAYLNKKRFESVSQSFPKCVYDAGLFET
jgi:23S rRNA-/tRNA-specific pseudouridylate synthase